MLAGPHLDALEHEAVRLAGLEVVDIELADHANALDAVSRVHGGGMRGRDCEADEDNDDQRAYDTKVHYNLLAPTGRQGAARS